MKPKLRRLLWMLAWGAAIYFVVQGGEFGTTDIVTQSLEKRRLTAAIESMKVEVDSLKKYEKAVKTDPKTQERIAREQWGMVRVNEILYLFDTIPETGRPPEK